MPINFLNTVDLNKNQLNQAVIQNVATDPASGVVGQIIFNTADDTLKQYVADTQNPPVPASPTPGWVEVGATSAVEDFTNTNTGSTYVDFSIQNSKATGNVNIGFADLNAVDGTSVEGTRFLSKDNTWDVISNIAKATATTLGTVKLFSNTVQTVAATAVSTTAARTYGIQFNSADQMVVNVPWTDTNVVTYTIDVPLNTTNINLKGSDSTDDFITLSGYAGQTVTNYIDDSTIQVALDDSVTIANSLTLTDGAFTQVAGGENNLNADLDMNSNKLLKVATGTDDTDGVNWGQVRDAIAGVGLFQGGYNATTGLTINLTTNGSLDGASNIALDKGDYFVVTTDGTAFYGVTLEVGDMIFANVDIAADSTPAQSVYTTVIQDANIAGSGATDGATQKGVAGFDSANFTVSAAGWVELKEEVLSGRMAKVLLTGGTDLDGETTFTVDLTAAGVFGAGATAADAIATVKVASSSLIVFPKVTGNGTGSLDFKFIPVVADDVYTAIISIV